MLSNLQPKVAVVVLNYNTRSLLERFLPSIVDSTYTNKEVWFVDNASTDDSVAFVQQNFKSVKVLESKENRGYAGGYNWALQQIAADYYILINSDVWVEPNWIEHLVDTAIRYPEVAAVQPKILDFKDKEKFEYAGAAGGYLDKWGYAFCRGRVFNELEQDLGQYNDEREIFWATGACLFFKAEAFHEVGGLDADFFAHMEEIDLCWRVQKRGYKVMVNPASVVYHLGGGTLSEGSDFKYELNFRNNLIMLVKNLDGWWGPTLLWRMVLDGVSVLKFIADGKPKLLKVVLKAHFAFWSSLSKTLNKRSEIRAKSTQRVELYTHSVVWQYFAKKKKTFKDLPGIQ
jgi:GT2 family glycosyltransferase